MLETCGAAPPKTLNRHSFARHAGTCHQGLQQHRLAGPPIVFKMSHFLQYQPAEFTILIYFDPTFRVTWRDTPLKGDTWNAVALQSGHHTEYHQLAY